MFDNGNVIRYNNDISKYEYIDIDELDALYILNEFTQIIGYIQSNKYIFYISYRNVTLHKEFINRFRMKMLSYNLGSIHSNINFINNRLITKNQPINNNPLIKKIQKYNT